MTGEGDGGAAKIRVLIADEDVPARVGLRTILSRESDIEVVAEVDNGWEACALAEELRPDVVVTDVQLAGLDGIETTKRIVSALGPATGVLILTTFDVVEHVHRSFDAGASAVLLKRASEEMIVSAVRATARGELTAVPAATASGQPLVAPLTHREEEVLRLVGRGESNREVADRLGVSVETVRTHLKHVYQKTGARNRVEAGVLAYRNSLMDPTPDGQTMNTSEVEPLGHEDEPTRPGPST